MKPIIVLSFLVLFAGAIGCQSSTQDAEAKPAEESSSRVYQPSELAQLMRSMYEDNMKIKEGIIKGQLPESFPEDFLKVHTAEATDPNDKDNTFHALADQYLKDMQAIVDADSAHAISTFNNMVNTCISCHQIYCQGPIEKIKKLHIPE